MSTKVNIMSLMDKYEQKFGDIFPTMCFQTDTDAELADKMKQCLQQGKPAEELFNLRDDVLY